ncbi:AraC family transcriptional regulator [Gluconobacter aidae]|nr:AraC family transcriptional regulator [Gluconobacter aidae]
MPIRIGLLLYPDFQLLDAAGVTATFEIAGTLGEAAYETTAVSRHGGLVRSSSGMTLETAPLAKAGTFDTFLVVGGKGHATAMDCPELQGFIRYHSGTARRICSVCTGAFLLAAAGLLDGRRATTHWEQAGALKARFPGIRVSADAIHVQDGPVWTSAGISAGIDMALALVSEDLGAEIGRRTAQQMVVFYHRPGGQSSSRLSLRWKALRNALASFWGGSGQT